MKRSIKNNKMLMLLGLLMVMMMPQIHSQECHPHCQCDNQNAVACHDVSTVPSPLPLTTIYLTLSNNFIGKILLKHKVDPLGALRLKRLYLKNNRIETIQDGAFLRLIYLEVLDLSNNNLPVISDRTFLGLSNLKYLYLNDAGIFSISKQPFLSTPSLREIDLEDNKLSIIERQFNSLVNMTELLLANNKITEIQPRAFSDLLRLEQLSLFGNQLRKPSISWFYNIIKNNGIIELDSRFTALAKEPNPWLCCPDVSFYHNFVQTANKSLRSYRQINIACSWPVALSGRLISTLTTDEINETPCSFASTTIVPVTAGETKDRANKDVIILKSSNQNFFGHLSDAGLFFILVLFILLGVVLGGFAYFYKTKKGRKKVHDFVVNFQRNQNDKDTNTSQTTKTFQQDPPSYGTSVSNDVHSPRRPPRPTRPAPVAPKPQPRSSVTVARESHSSYQMDPVYSEDEIWNNS